MAISFSKQTSNSSTLEIQIYSHHHGFQVVLVHVVNHRTTSPTAASTTTNHSFLARSNPLSPSLTPYSSSYSHFAYTSTSTSLPPYSTSAAAAAATTANVSSIPTFAPIITTTTPTSATTRHHTTTTKSTTTRAARVVGYLNSNRRPLSRLCIARYNGPHSEEENSNGRLPEPYELIDVTVRRESNRVADLPDPIKSPTPALRESVYK
ncbi:hypothetical protein SO802_010838 [Lithocarpus litseifolius]|uniref:Uncharacterized protein n=1 Tax=Lithocarpus litseifolius TaxID=425828 RepID=A0AAW2DKW6_9ROSI